MGPEKFVMTVCAFFHLCKNALTAEIQKGCNLPFFVSIESEPRQKSMSPIMREGKHFRQKQSEPRKANTVESGVSVQTNPRTDKIETTPSVVKAIIILPVQMRMVGTELGNYGEM